MKMEEIKRAITRIKQLRTVIDTLQDNKREDEIFSELSNLETLLKEDLLNDLQLPDYRKGFNLENVHSWIRIRVENEIWEYSSGKQKNIEYTLLELEMLLLYWNKHKEDVI